jgi:hypothetical protein
VPSSRPRPVAGSRQVTAEVLTTRRLNRALLARQLLLDRSDLPLTAVLEQVGGLQTQYAPSGYIGLWSRMEGFERPMLTRALEERQVVQATMMRATIHMVSEADYWPLTAAVRRTRREWFERVSRREIDKLDMAGAVAAVRAELAAGPRRMAELEVAVERAGQPKQTARWAGMYIDLVRVPPSGTWDRRRADLYALAEDWLGAGEVSEEQGLELLIRRYLGAFGPAPLADIGSWGGLPPALVKQIVGGMGLRRYRDGKGGELLDLPEAPLPPEETPAPVRFLPTWDATLLVHARRTQILPEQYRPLIFNTKTPPSVPTFLVDGQVAGTWRWQDGRIELSPFNPLPDGIVAQVEEEAHRLAALHGD